MEALLTATGGALLLAVKLTLIVVPLVMVFELLRHLALFRRTGRAVEPLMRGMGLTPAAAVPLFTGIFLGIAYGAGIIIKVARERRLPPKELFLMGLFLATCHAVVEDTLIFVAIGGSGWQMLGIRILLAVVITGLLARFWRQQNPPEAKDPDGLPGAGPTANNQGDRKVNSHAVDQCQVNSGSDSGPIGQQRP